MPQARDEAGNIWETDAQGNAVRLLQAAGPQMPADPSFPYEGAQAQAQAANTGAQAQVNQATIPAQITSANADATAKTRTAQTAGLPEGFMWAPDGKTAVPIPGYSRQGLSPEIRSQAIQAFSDADALERAADEIERLFQAGPGATSGLAGLKDYLPTTANKVFNDAGQQARGYVKRALGFTGGEGNTVAESSALYDPYLPSAGDRDEQIVAKIAKLRSLAEDARLKSMRTLGGVPDEAGNIVPVPENRPNALTIPRVIPGQPLEAAGAGATTAGQPVDPNYQAEYTAWVTQNAGRFTPEQYAAFRSGLDQKYGYGATADYVTEGQRIADSFARGGSQNLTIPPTEEPLSEGAFGGQARNNAVSNPIGAAAAGFADMAGFGGVSALAPNQMAALGDAQPVASTLGQMGGAVLGTGILSSALRNTAGRAAPQLLQGGNRAALARDVATDAAYSGIYGANTGQDPLASAGLGAAGSLGGRAVGAGLGKTVSGANVSSAVEALKARGIPMTVPQQLGGFAKSVEDKATSIPLVGDMIRARRMEGLDAFNREAFSEAGVPIGATVRDIGEEGVQQLTDQIGSAYDQATAGVTVPLDGQFLQDFSSAVARGQQLPRDLRRRLGQVLDARVQPIADAGELTGEQYQQAFRALKKTRANPPQQFGGFEQDYRDAVTGAMDALEGQITRGAPQVAPALNAANAANRNKGALASAVRTAAGGSQSGEAFMFTPNQLQRAGLATEAKFPGPRPFAELADAGQRVLPSQVPDSGTAGRVAQMAMPAALGGTGAGLGFMASGDAQGAQTGATYGALATALALLGGTKAGQKALQKALIDRSPRAVAIGNAIKNKRGLFGSASLPLLIAN